MACDKDQTYLQVRWIRDYLGWLEHFTSLGEFGKLPATLGVSNPDSPPCKYSMFVINTAV
jgi:hypothetical protein